ncbi:hypothetical protein ACTXT7_007827 [Hymenolepis weldensis]
MSFIAGAIGSIREDLPLWECLLTFFNHALPVLNILVEVVFVGEKPKALLHLKVFDKMSLADFPGFSSIMPCTLLTNSGIPNESEQSVDNAVFSSPL